MNWIKVTSMSLHNITESKQYTKVKITLHSKFHRNHYSRFQENGYNFTYTHNNIGKRSTNGRFPWCSLGPGVAAAAPGCPSCTCRRSPASAAAAWSRTCSCRGLTWNVTGRHDQIWHDRKLIFESSLVVIVNSYSRMLFALQDYGSRIWLETNRSTSSNSYVPKSNDLNK